MVSPENPSLGGARKANGESLCAEMGNEGKQFPAWHTPSPIREGQLSFVGGARWWWEVGDGAGVQQAPFPAIWAGLSPDPGVGAFL